MKLALWLALPVALVATGTSPLTAAEGFNPKPPKANVAAKPRPQHGELTKQRSKRTTDSKIEVLDKSVKIEKIRSDKRGSLIARSAVISYRGEWTIVPKEAILNTPSHLSRWINGKREGKLVTWQQFFAKNRGWIQAQEVTLPQARGEEPLPQGVLNKIANSGRVVVAVCHDGPISVKPAAGGKDGKKIAGQKNVPARP